MKGTTLETPQSLRPNSQYLLAKIGQCAPHAKSLDFGCGSGALVAAARARGFDMYGAETFYDGLRTEDAATARSWGCDENVIREITAGRIDFPDNHFDIVVHNQVFEHVKDLRQASAEIQRVLKSGGVMVGIFPTKGVFREPHLSLPCVHWFSPGVNRNLWARAMRSLGFGFEFWGKGEDWFERAFSFLDDFVVYRSRKEIASILNPLFDLKWTEPEWLGFRVPTFKWMLDLPGGTACARKFSRMAAGVVVEGLSRK